jgi:hypothetical protein
LLGTVEEQYGIDLDKRSDMKLGNYLDEQWIDSLKDVITGK